MFFKLYMKPQRKCYEMKTFILSNNKLFPILCCVWKHFISNKRIVEKIINWIALTFLKNKFVQNGREFLTIRKCTECSLTQPTVMC
jgi:hypothetical protein